MNNSIAFQQTPLDVDSSCQGRCSNNQVSLALSFPILHHRRCNMQTYLSQYLQTSLPHLTGTLGGRWLQFRIPPSRGSMYQIGIIDHNYSFVNGYAGKFLNSPNYPVTTAAQELQDAVIIAIAAVIAAECGHQCGGYRDVGRGKGFPEPAVEGLGEWIHYFENDVACSSLTAARTSGPQPPEARESFLRNSNLFQLFRTVSGSTGRPSW